MTGHGEGWGSENPFYLSLYWHDWLSGQWETSGKVWSEKDYPLGKHDQVREHLNKLYVHRAIGTNRMHPGCWGRWPMSLQGYYYLWKVPLTEGNSQRLQENKWHSYLQKGQEGKSEDWQVGQRHLSPWESNWANPPENHLQTHESQDNDGK